MAGDATQFTFVPSFDRARDRVHLGVVNSPDPQVDESVLALASLYSGLCDRWAIVN